MRRVIKILLGGFIIICSILAIDEVLTYVLVDNEKDEVRFAMHEIYEQENIETLFLGSSHVFCGYDPRILDETLGENTYLAATPVQKIDGSYYLLKEILKKNDVQKVYLDMYYRQYRDIPAERTDAQVEYIYCITDNMKHNWNRIEFLLNAVSYDRYIEGFFVPSRYGNQLLNISKIENMIKSKRSEAYVNYEDPNGEASSFYKGALFVPGTPGNPNKIGMLDPFGIAPISENVISEYSKKYLDKIVKLCNEEEIQLVLVATPFTNYHIQAMGNYDVFYEYMKEYAQVNNIEYYDFNLCKNEILDLEDNDFMDAHHLSGKGAVKYSTAFADIMTSYNEAERQELFYNTVQEKMEDLPPQIMGIIIEKSMEEENTYLIETVANYDIDVEYRICLVDEEGVEKELIQDFSDGNIIKGSTNREKSFKITVRFKDTGEICEEGIINL